MTNPPVEPGDEQPGQETAPEVLADSPAAEEALLDAAAKGEAPQPDQTVAVEAPEVKPEPPMVARFFRYLVTANSVMVTIYSMILAMVIGGILIIVSDPEVRSTYSYFFSRPGDALSASWTAVSDAYVALFEGAIVNIDQYQYAVYGEPNWPALLRPISDTLTNAAPLIFTGLAVAMAFRSGLFNIGAQGQAVLGGIGAAIAGFGLHLPVVLHIIVVLIAGALSGALWGGIPGVLKARTGAHEVITSIMLNYVAGFLLLWVISTKFVHSPDHTDAISKSVDETGRLPKLFGVFGIDNRANLGIVLALVAAGFVAWLLGRSTLGFRMRTVGQNPDAARTAGMNVSTTYATSMACAGALAGLGGATIMLSSTSVALTPAVIGNIGFDGITVALLGRARPVGVILSGLLFGAMQAGASKMQAAADIPVDMVTLLQAIIVIFIAAPALVKAIFHLRAPKGTRQDLTMAKGW